MSLDLGIIYRIDLQGVEFLILGIYCESTVIETRLIGMVDGFISQNKGFILDLNAEFAC